MNIFRSMVGSGAGGVSEQDTVDTVEKLVDRVHTASLIEDRRDAVKALRSLAKKYRVEVGGRAMQVLLEVVEKDPSNTDTASLALDALAIIIDPDDDAENDELGQRFAEIFVSKNENMSTVLSMLEDYEFNIRRPTVRLLTGLLRHRPHDVQEKLLHDPSAIPKIMDMLQESREILRNDTVLMLCELTRGNAHIQKLVAYENAFELLLDIVAREGDSIVVEDCLFVIINLLKNNASNQQLFREHSLIQKIRTLLDNVLHHRISDEDDIPNGLTTNHVSDKVEWSPQRTNNVHMFFQVLRCLVTPSNPNTIRQAAQKVVLSCGLLDDLCQLLLASGIPADVLTEAIVTVAESIRGHATSQNFFGNVMAPVSPPRPAVLVLLMSMVNDRQPFSLRCAVLYCFQSYLYKNEDGKQQVIHTLLPSSTQSTDLTAGHLLCTALISNDSLLVWLSCVSLMHCLLNSPSLKEQLLRVQLATNLGEAPISLLQQVWNVLIQHGGRNPQVRAGILMLLIVWMEECPVAVTHFLHKEDNLAYLTSQTCGSGGSEASETEEVVLQGLSAFLLALCVFYNDESVERNNRKAVVQMLERRVGCDSLVELIECVSSSELYVRAAQKPIPAAKQTNDLLLDYEFAKVFKRLEGDLVRVLRPGENNSTSGASLPHSVEQHDSIVKSYKDLIKRQDAQIVELTSQLKRLQEQVQREDEIQDIKQQVQVDTSQIDRLNAELSDKCRIIEEQKILLQSKDGAHFENKLTNGVPEAQRDDNLVAENAQLKYQIEHLNYMIGQKQNETAWYQQQAAQWQAYYSAQTEAASQGTELNLAPHIAQTMEAQLREVEQQLAFGWQAYEQQSAQLAQMTGEKAHVEEQMQQMSSAIAGLREQVASKEATPAVAPPHDNAELDQLKHKFASVQKQMHEVVIESMNHKEARLLAENDCNNLRKEQDDLLVLLADQDQKIRDYRRRMLAMGQTVSEDEGSDEGDEDDAPESLR